MKTMSEQWDSFLDAYTELREEKEDIVRLARDMVPHLHKAKREKFRGQLKKLLKEGKEDGEG